MTEGNRLIEQVEARQMLAATATLNDGELRVELSSTVNTSVDVTYTNSRIAVQVQDEAASRRIYFGLRRVINSIRIIGSGAADRITLGENIRATTVEAGAGKDTVVGNLAANVIYGGAGDDSLDGSGGDDQIYGEGGRDILHGGDGNDNINGGSDIDHLFGDAGNDQLEGGASRHTDYLDGGPGADRMIGGDEFDHLINFSAEDIFFDPDLGDESNFSPA